MAIVEKIVCDVCGVEKREVNHWLVAFTHERVNGIAFELAENVNTPRHPLLKYDDICGQECAHKRLSQYLETLK